MKTFKSIYENFQFQKHKKYRLTVESDSYDKNDMKKKVNVLVRLHEAMQEKSKTATYSEPIQIFILVADKWSRMYYSEYFNILEYLV